MMAWLALLVPSALIGAACGYRWPGRRGTWAGGAVPWLGLLLWQLYHEYVAPYRGGGASMWPIAQLIAGTAAALVGMAAARAAATVRTRRQPRAG